MTFSSVYSPSLVCPNSMTTMTLFTISLTALTNALQLSPRLLYTLVLLLVPSSLFLLSRFIGNAATDFRTKDGRKMVVLKQDTRKRRKPGSSYSFSRACAGFLRQRWKRSFEATKCEFRSIFRKVIINY
ncbi:hypothetical protein BGX38DRAFT_600880 [Terfezia claveryi]|nr:hypothetical protein BGX38DRAFT_600880 [Terfezia claveryi]